MSFKDRTDAGRLLADKLTKYSGEDVIVFAIPRGGVMTAVEIAKRLHAPLDLVITRKITHPYNPEYAIAATSENGHIVGNRRELAQVDEDWLEEEIEKQRLEAKRRRLKYLGGKKTHSLKGKTVILVDDGVATSLSLRAAIIEMKHHNPKKIIVAVPVIPMSSTLVVRAEVNELVALKTPPDSLFLGAVGAYYDDFQQVSDEKVISILESYKKWLSEAKNGRLYGEQYAENYLQ